VRHSTTAAVQPSASKPEEPAGWAMKYKVAAGSVVAVAVPWMFSYAIRHDLETRKSVEKWLPGGTALVKYVRKRQGGLLSGETREQRTDDARRRALYQHPLTFTVQLSSGESRELTDVDAHTPLKQLQDIAHGDVVGYEFSDIDVWSQPPLSEDFLDDSSLDSAANSSVPVEVRMCNTMSWWQRAALARSKAADGRAAAAAAAAAAPAQTTRSSQQQQQKQQQQPSADTARAIAADLQLRIDELEREKLTSMRSIDDIDADIEVLKSKLVSVQKVAGKRRRFWLF
jgi:pyruvate/2-oxoglutarate dehydrogenase complex dihydrolipoamide acyltransferase (E2) component